MAVFWATLMRPHLSPLRSDTNRCTAPTSPKFVTGKLFQCLNRLSRLGGRNRNFASAAFAQPHRTLLGTQFSIMAHHSQLLILSVSRKLRLCSAPECPFRAMFGWPVTSQAIACWGRATVEGWAVVALVEIFRVQPWNRSATPLGWHEDYHRNRVYVIAGEPCQTGWVLYMSTILSSLKLLNHESFSSLFQETIPPHYFNPHFSNSSASIKHKQSQDVSVLISIEAPTPSGRRGSLHSSSASLQTLSPLSPPPLPWQVILHLRNSDYRTTI